MAMIIGPFELDPDAFELRLQGKLVPVEPQVFELLVMLVENRGQVVTKDELVERIWNGRIVSDATISSRIKSARQAIGDDGSSQRLIKTVHGRGFRFVGDVVVEENVPSPPRGVIRKGEDADSSAGPSQPPFQQRSFMDRPAVLVLPFENAGGDPGQNYIIDGIADGLIGALSAWRTFPVISRNTSFRYRRTEKSPSQIRLETGAQYIVSGFATASGAKTRLSIELAECLTDRHIWSGRYLHDTDDLFNLQDEMGRSIVREIEPEIRTAELRRISSKPPQVHTAWDLSLRSLWHIHRWNRADYDIAERLAMSALERDAGWGYPQGLIAFIAFQRAMAGWSTAKSKSAFKPTLVAAQSALAVDQRSWMAHALAGVGELWTNGDHDRALGHLHRAIDLNPSASWSYHFCGCISGFCGDTEAAKEAQQSVFRVDPAYPYSMVVEADLALWNMVEGRLENAQRHIDRAMTLDPTYARAVQRLAVIHALRGERAEAASATRRLRSLGTFDRAYFESSYPFRDLRHKAVFFEGLKRSGLLS